MVKPIAARSGAETDVPPTLGLLSLQAHIAWRSLRAEVARLRSENQALRMELELLKAARANRLPEL